MILWHLIFDLSQIFNAVLLLFTVEIDERNWKLVNNLDVFEEDQQFIVQYIF